MEQPFLAYTVICVAGLLICGLVCLSNNSNNVASKAGTRRPPLVKYSLPWIGSAIDIGKNPDAFFQRVSSQLGPIFRVTAVGQEIIYITSPELISAIYRDVKTFEFAPIRIEVARKIFGISHATSYSSYMTDVFRPMHHQALSPKSVLSLVQRYTGYAFENVLKAVDKFDGSTTPLAHFLMPPAYHSAACTFFGRAFNAEKSYNPFRTFDGQFHIRFTGVPEFMLPGVHRAWEQLVKLFEEYLETSHEDASELVQNIQASSRDANIPTRDVARILGSDFWAFQANTIYAAYWAIALELQKPEGLTALVAEVDRARLEWKTDHPNESLSANQAQWVLEASLPLMTATIQEALRVSTSSFPIRRVNNTVDFAGFRFEEGERVVCVTRAVHMDDEIHPNPQHFNSQRYLEGQAKFSKNGKNIPNHSMPFGGGVSMCEGRHFAMGELKVLLGLMLTYATIEVDQNSPSRPTYLSARMGTGVMPPVGDLSVKISKRSDIA